MVVKTSVAMMPYNTRRKLLSLPSLGIHLPVTHASRNSAQTSPPSVAVTAASMETPTKRIKRSHNQSLPPTVYHSKRVPIRYENTPPPSPTAETDERSDNWFKPVSIDLEGIKDEIVEAVILQLQKTGNRPHLVKELAAILRCHVKIVEQSANPSAIISSRLSAFIKRPWSPSSPCPISKVLETIHPRRTHYYLTNSPPHRPLLDSSDRESADTAAAAAARAIISPSISSAASRFDEAESDRRRELSPSPEIDLFPPECDDDTQDYQARPSVSRFPCQIKQMPLTPRSTSPPLEKEEKEFTQAARGMQKRKISDVISDGILSDTEDYTARNLDCELLFEKQSHHLSSLAFLSSPNINSSGTSRRINDDSNITWFQPDADALWDMRCPELVELEELDGMFDDL
ncbi:putative mucin [Erysiphe neolycopersici]|uniref:Putative mucin n=1 Tax=Erysiphe neolycopersici TaxID=212602 RepID=A0A420H7H0_9PEZI|nr:putative mucin [Erysiphe neolycopersici]